MKALGEAATHLPWLCPCAASLRALARAPTGATWAQVRADPGAVLLILRQTAAQLVSPDVVFFPALLREPAVLEGAVQFLTAGGRTRNADRQPPFHSSLLHSRSLSAFVDWSEPTVERIYQATLRYARLAEAIANISGHCDPEVAWVTAMLAPLGWLAVSAVDPELAGACLADASFTKDPAATQQCRWGLDQAAIARRLLLRWHVPRWLVAIVGHLELPVATAQALGAEPRLFRVAQTAVRLAENQASALHLLAGISPAEASALLDLSAEQHAALVHELDAPDPPPDLPRGWTPPHNLPLLYDLLETAAENRRLRDEPILDQLALESDRLHEALVDQQAAEIQKLQAQKLSALAEFAAGAGHEINNPLAVISGQAQYLLKRLQLADGRWPIADPAAGDNSAQAGNLQAEIGDSLETIIGQAQRIHQTLNELMQFARPPRPRKELIDVAEMIRGVSESLHELAGQRQVHLAAREPQQPITLYADPNQLRTALVCLLRNAVEAAPPDGWASLRVEMPEPDRVELIVEDNGSGPTPAQREHLFDPFYSGRLAGRGRGLGLPTAWRLAREHGGDVRFDAPANGSTRFVLSLPIEPQRSAIRTQELGIGNQTIDTGVCCMK